MYLSENCMRALLGAKGGQIISVMIIGQRQEPVALPEKIDYRNTFGINNTTILLRR
jgi:hypothetical protein